MIHAIVGIFTLALIIMSVISGIVVMKGKEDEYPKCLTFNWTFLLMLYMVVVGLCYFVYLMFPYVIKLLDIMRGSL